MKRWLLVWFFFFAPASFAQMGVFDQSPAPTVWKSISNDFVEILFPDYMQPKAAYVANLISHYSKTVGASYGISRPEKFVLVLRPDLALPNGFVTLGPRRSEWFTSSTMSPSLSSMEWYQSLAIHEYRHLQQFDFFRQTATKIPGYLFGDTGDSIMMVLSTPGWFFEGDAVWAETKYSDSGRGRMPRFLSRLKGVLLGGEIPSYDQFISGTFKTNLPNHYVLGYVLISRASQKFGEDFWRKVFAETATWPLPFSFENNFKAVSGESFEDFYLQTMVELKSAWSHDASPDVQTSEYKSESFPHKDQNKLYFLRSDLDTPLALYRRDHDGDTKIKEINFIGGLSQLDIESGQAVYNSFAPDARYGFRNYSDVVLLDLKTSTSKSLLTKGRFYAPRLSPSGERVLAVEFAPDQTWRLIEVDSEGTRRRSVTLAHHDLVEADYLDQDRVAAIAVSRVGRRSIVEIDLNTSKSRQLLAGTQNMITSLKTDALGHVLFEADYQDYTEVFRLAANGGQLAKCTASRIGAYTPSSDGRELFYTDETSFGKVLKTSAISACQQLATERLLDFNYLGQGPSSNFNNVKPVAFPNQGELYEKDAELYQPKAASGFDRRAFTPHSWSFLGGRGFALSARTDNYQRDFSADVLLGTSAEENAAYSSLELQFRRFYPVFSLIAAGRERQAEFAGVAEPVEWRESEVGLGVALPYASQHGVFSHQTVFSSNLTRLETARYSHDDLLAQASLYAHKAVSLQSYIAKSGTARSLQAPWAAALQLSHDDASSRFDAKLSARRSFAAVDFNTPGLFKHDGLRLAVSTEVSDIAPSAYQFIDPVVQSGSYRLSRGYDYVPVERYVKESLDYYFPIAYPDFSAGRYLYLKRITGDIFYDQTRAQLFGDELSFKSAGAEVGFQMVVARLLPLDYRAQYIRRYADGKDKVNFFVAVNSPN